MKRRVFFACVAAALALAAALLAVIRPWTWQPLDLAKITSPAQATVIFDRNGRRAASAGARNRTLLAAEDMPEVVKRAFVAIEDTRFYSHAGIDLKRIGGALLSDTMSGSAREGGSTITQQLVKLTHLSGEKTLARKAQEAWLALKLERSMSKDDILAAYLNAVYFGSGAYGIEAAARTYFDRPASELTLAQAATLAGVVKSPSNYAPHLNERNALERRDLVLERMREQGFISAEECAAAQAEPLGARVSGSGEGGWYVDAVIEEACAALGVSADELMSGGWRVYTALDPAMQALSDALFADLTRFPEGDGQAQPEAALVAIDTACGEILCMEGGRQYAVRRGFNRATQMKRQPGSAFKPVSVYAAAVDMLGCTPITMLDDSPRAYDGYSPANASGSSYGLVTLRRALVKSMNQATVNLLSRVGIDAARLYAQRLGIELSDNDRNYALGLGALTEGVSPARLCAAYCALANGGMAVEPHAVRRIEDSEGREVYAFKAKNERAMSEISAYLLTDVLRETAASGTAKALASVGAPVAAKTGTVGEADGGNRDAWTAAYTPRLAVTVWMGYDEPDGHELRQGVTGGGYPARLAAAFLAANAKGEGDFPMPQGVERVLLDSRSLQPDIARPMLAAEDTPRACLLIEALPAGAAPKQVSGLWKASLPVGTVYAQKNEAGQPVVSFVAPDSVSVWRVMRVQDGEATEIARLTGERGDYLSVVDGEARGAAGYVVIARQKYYEEMGRIVEAEPSREAFFREETLFERLFATGE
ncbi:MAG: PBP1A family penicillin-binding protein [Clostridia bacterium]|nr:PBP1A family penicillin-binding protein [Clostridia bacterium]